MLKCYMMYIVWWPLGTDFACNQIFLKAPIWPGAVLHTYISQAICLIVIFSQQTNGIPRLTVTVLVSEHWASTGLYDAVSDALGTLWLCNFAGIFEQNGQSLLTWFELGRGLIIYSISQ